MPLTAYPGFNPVTVFPGSPASGYGRWPTPLEMTGGDPRSAVNLMAAVESLTDRTNFIGWRVINIVDGGTYAFTTAISLANPWTFVGSATAAGAFLSTGGFSLRGAGMIASNATLTVGDPGGFSLGHIVVHDDNDITIGGSTSHPGKLIAASNSLVQTQSGSTIEVLAGSSLVLNAPVGLGMTQPASSATPVQNTLYSTNTPKAWGSVTTDGAGGKTVDDGFNIASLTFSGSLLRVHLAQAMGNANYAAIAITDGNALADSRFASVSNRTTTTFDIAVFASDTGNIRDLTSDAITIMFSVFGRQ